MLESIVERRVYNTVFDRSTTSHCNGELFVQLESFVVFNCQQRCSIWEENLMDLVFIRWYRMFVYPKCGNNSAGNLKYQRLRQRTKHHQASLVAATIINHGWIPLLKQFSTFCLKVVNMGNIMAPWLSKMLSMTWSTSNDMRYQLCLVRRPVACKRMQKWIKFVRTGAVLSSPYLVKRRADYERRKSAMKLI